MTLDYDGFVEAMTPFLVSEGFICKKEKGNVFGFYKPTGHNTKDEYFFKFRSYSGGSSVDGEYGTRFSKMLKYMEVTDWYGDMKDTIFCTTIACLLHTTEEMETALNFFKKIYFEWAVPFYLQNSTLMGALETLQSRDEYLAPNMPRETGKTATNFNGRELDLFLTKVLKPEEFTWRIEYYKNASRIRIMRIIEGLKEAVVKEEFRSYIGSETLLLDNLPKKMKDIDDLVEKINNIDIIQARRELCQD